MSSKIAVILIQTGFFLMALTVISFFAEVLPVASAGTPFKKIFNQWASTELVFSKMMLRLLAASVYVLFRNRRLFLNR
jgi:hypothetical protein